MAKQKLNLKVLSIATTTKQVSTGEKTPTPNPEASVRSPFWLLLGVLWGSLLKKKNQLTNEGTLTHQKVKKSLSATHFLRKRVPRGLKTNCLKKGVLDYCAIEFTNASFSVFH